MAKFCTGHDHLHQIDNVNFLEFYKEKRYYLYVCHYIRNAIVAIEVLSSFQQIRWSIRGFSVQLCFK